MGIVKKAVIPAAGLGTRFLPYTKAVAKEMLPIVDKPALQFIVEEVVASGIREVLIITGRNKQNIENHFDRVYELENLLKRTNKLDSLKLINDITDMADIHYIRQKEAKGLGHAILCARIFVSDQPFAVLLGDDVVYTGENKPCLKQLMDCFEEKQKSILGVQRVPKTEVNKYGIVTAGKSEGCCHEVASLVEKPPIDKAPSNIAVLGRYIITPKIFDYLEKQQPGVGGEIQLTDALKELAADEGMYAYEFEGKRYDIGDKEGYLEATVEYALRDSKLAPKFSKYLKNLAKDL
jgi:UTP--glucose-1-phosphate uridylyltransferase